MFVVGCLLLVVGCLFFVVLLIVGCLLLAACCLLLLVVCCFLFSLVAVAVVRSLPLVAASFLASEPLAVVVLGVEEVPWLVAPATMLSLTPDRLEGFVQIEASGIEEVN